MIINFINKPRTISTQMKRTHTCGELGIKDVKKKDIVLCKVKGNHYLHLVKAVGKKRVLIGNNHGHINGWTKNIYGKVVGKS